MTHIHIADIHFGAIDASVQYNILKEQFLDVIAGIDFDVLSIDGDLFDRKYLANSEPIYYANMFVHNCIQICASKGAAFILISGTESHDAGQLMLFRNLNEVFPMVEIYVVESIQFVHTHGYKILCIPEIAGMGEAYYFNYLNQGYDLCFMHGTIAGAVYGCNKPDLNARRPVFGLEHFHGCRGPIIAGHVHERRCLEGYMYYVSNPIRYRFGEEGPKGFAIFLSNEYGQHYCQYMDIKSFEYNTLDLSTVGTADPDSIVNYVSNYVANTGTDNVRLICNGLPEATQSFIHQYYKQSPVVKVERVKGDILSADVNTTETVLDKYAGLDFILDPELNEYEKLARFIKFNEAEVYLSSVEIKEIVEKK